MPEALLEPPIVQQTQTNQAETVQVVLNLTPDDFRLAEDYARLHSIPVECAFKRALMELIEDEYDAAVGEIAYAEWVRGGCKSRPFSELCAELAAEENK